MQTINKKAMAKQYMILNVLAFAEENGKAFENDALFQKHLQTLKTNATDILALEDKVLRYRMPLGEQKHKLLEDYMSAASVLIDALNEVGTLAPDNDMLQFLSNCKTSLWKTTDFGRLGLSRSLFDYVKAYRTELDALNKGKEIADTAEANFEAYQEFVLLPGQKRKKAATFFSDYNKLLEATNVYIRKHIRPFFNRAFIDQTSLLDLFDRYLEIPKTAKRSSKAEATEGAANNSADNASAAAPETSATAESVANPSNGEAAATDNNSSLAQNPSAAPAASSNTSSSEVS